MTIKPICLPEAIGTLPFEFTERLPRDASYMWFTINGNRPQMAFLASWTDDPQTYEPRRFVLCKDQVPDGTLSKRGFATYSYGVTLTLFERTHA